VKKEIYLSLEDLQTFILYIYIFYKILCNVQT